jgi:Ser/Thr protein kinase RdoA (MazF antagonist)
MSVVNFAPVFSRENALRIAKELYGLEGEMVMFPSERDQNFRLRCESGEQYVLKIANSTEEYALLDAQNQAMEHVGQIEKLLPNIVVSQNGSAIRPNCSLTWDKSWPV